MIITVPHLSRLHEEPHDYFRFTVFGLRKMFFESGFKEISILPLGGLFSFLGHQLSTILLCSAWNIPIIKNIVFILNKVLFVKLLYLFDKHIDKRKIFALGYASVLEKVNAGVCRAI